MGPFSFSTMSEEFAASEKLLLVNYMTKSIHIYIFLGRPLASYYMIKKVSNTQKSTQIILIGILCILGSHRFKVDSSYQRCTIPFSLIKWGR